MRIALPVTGSQLATVFDYARDLLLVDIGDSGETARTKVALPNTLPSIRARTLVEQHVNTLICGAISNPLAAMIWHSGVDVIAGVTGDIDDVIQAFIRRELHLPRYLLPGLGASGRCGWGGFGRRRRRRGRQWR